MAAGNPNTEFEDPARITLLQELKDALPKYAATVTPTVWALLWLSDLGKLQDLVTLAKAKPYIVRAAIDGIVAGQIVERWTQKLKTVSAPTSTIPSAVSSPNLAPTGASTAQRPGPNANKRGKKRGSMGNIQDNGRDNVPDVGRSSAAREAAHRRDNRSCVITHAGLAVHVAHIYPFSMRNDDDETPFWDNLRLFWDNERIDSWLQAIFAGPNKTEVCQNLICLAAQAHHYWERGCFALRPIHKPDAGETQIHMQFFWLSSTKSPTGVDIRKVPSFEADLDQGPGLSKLFDHRTNRAVQSGDIITVTTDNTLERPLPSFELLQMQWFLHRVVALRGAAESQDPIDSDDSDIYDPVPAFRDQLAYDWCMDIEESRLEGSENSRFLPLHDNAVPVLPMVQVGGLRGGASDEHDSREEEHHH